MIAIWFLIEALCIGTDPCRLSTFDVFMSKEECEHQLQHTYPFFGNDAAGHPVKVRSALFCKKVELKQP